MTDEKFQAILADICERLTTEARTAGFVSAKAFENRVRTLARELITDPAIHIDLDPPAQGFPDIAAGRFGIEVKFTTNDTWLSIANSVLETNRVAEVENIFVVFGKMGGTPDVRWSSYEDCVVHVRTSHVPRFEVELPPAGGTVPLFQQMGISYDQFRQLPMDEKMRHIREYARGRLKKGERLWWLEDSAEPEHTLPIQARLYTKLSMEEKTRLRAEAVLLCPRVVESGRTRDKYDDVVLYLLTYHGVLCHQARDLFSAGSVANPDNDDNGGVYIQRALKLIEADIVAATARLDDAVFVEYWGESVKPSDRIARWLEKADGFARDWLPSASLFLEYQDERARQSSPKA
ncbi:restriction endonuclease [Acidovorax sp. 210-6]|uniref:restriction endonuclease n=1 Tax=Acidovorax sp. 210-6 TaxID=2699468 RepID=UPI0013898FD4|nr:restriction endonuclease [Acidovorax sp. 210-6]NCU67186.1 restriction endonuclease [Acidovorax sp. 210-6]